MARGDQKAFYDYPRKAGLGNYNNSTNTFKVALLTDTYASVSQTLTDPVLTSFTEVTPGGNYSAGGITLTTVTWTRAGAVTKLDADDLSLLKNASNPANARTALVYNDTVADNAYSVVDLTTDGTTPLDLVNNDLNITWNASGIITATVA